MDLKNLAEPFKESEVEWRIGSCGKKSNGQIWATCLAYIQARAIMDRLDEVCGPENWTTNYEFIGATGVICRIAIRCGFENSWTSKEDGAEMTDIESFKGGISSALKRAGSVWGIGRYLYGLDTGFAQVVQDRKGAQYGKTKDGTEFYWLPPGLPDWALPGASQRGLVDPRQPEAHEGDPDAIHEEKFTRGSFMKKAPREVDIHELRKWVEKVEERFEKAKADGKPIADLAEWERNVELAVAYIVKMETGVKE